MTPQQLAANLLELKNTLPDIMGKLIKENAHVVEDLQTDQLNAGMDSEGNPIGPPYRPLTVTLKKAKGQPYDRVTLKDEGDFHAGLFLSGGAKNQFAIGSSDPKTGKLQAKYGDEILGLNEASQHRLIDDLLRPEIGTEALKVLKKN